MVRGRAPAATVASHVPASAPVEGGGFEEGAPPPEPLGDPDEPDEPEDPEDPDELAAPEDPLLALPPPLPVPLLLALPELAPLVL